jgi:small redox-active disulfide protein 2
MALLEKKEKKEKKKSKKDGGASEDAPVKVLGIGCANCQRMEANVREAVAELGLDCDVGHVREMQRIAAYGVMSMPALVIGGRVVSSGKVLTKEEAKEILSKEVPA